MTKRAVLYARVSGDDRHREDRDLIGKLDRCREYAQQRGHEIIAELNEPRCALPPADGSLHRRLRQRFPAHTRTRQLRVSRAGACLGARPVAYRLDRASPSVPVVGRKSGGGLTSVANRGMMR